MPQSRLSRFVDILVAVCKAAAYLILFLVSQTLITLAVTAVYTLWSYLNGEDLDQGALLADVMAQTPLITVVSGALTLLVLLLFFLLRRKKPLREVGLVKTSFVETAAAASLAPALYVVVIVVMNQLPAAWLEDYAQASAGVNSTGLLAFLGTVIAAPLVEEIIFRGLIQSRLGRVMPGWLAALLAAAVFGACHGQFVWAAYAFLLGAFFGWFRLRTGSTWPSLAAHFAFNLIGFLSVYLENAGVAHLMLPGLLAVSLIGCLLFRRGLVLLFRRAAQSEVPPDAT